MRFVDEFRDADKAHAPSAKIAADPKACQCGEVLNHNFGRMNRRRVVEVSIS
jgi:hypothetical protein